MHIDGNEVIASYITKHNEATFSVCQMLWIFHFFSFFSCILVSIPFHWCNERERERESAWKKCKLYTIRSKIQNDFDGDAGIRICIPLSALLHSMKRWKLLEYWKHMEKEINREIVERVMEFWFDLLVIQMNVISM